MSKFLRYLTHDFTDTAGCPDPAARQVVGSALEIGHIPWMYEHFVTPLPANGVSKLLLNFTTEDLELPPSEVLGIATVFEHFDVPKFSVLPAHDRQLYFLDRVQAALLRSATHFGWNPAPIHETYRRIVDANFHFDLFWKKSVASPDRRLKVQAYIAVSPFPTHLYLVFFDSRSHELRRVLLNVGANALGPIEFMLGQIQWVDPETVQVTHQNHRDYWLCSTSGAFEFCYPRAEAGDPHGQYDLGRMYYDGLYVLQDREQGLKWIRQAADKGFKHAVKFLEKL